MGTYDVSPKWIVIQYSIHLCRSLWYWFYVSDWKKDVGWDCFIYMFLENVQRSCLPCLYLQQIHLKFMSIFVLLYICYSLCVMYLERDTWVLGKNVLDGQEQIYSEFYNCSYYFLWMSYIGKWFQTCFIILWFSKRKYNVIL